MRDSDLDQLTAEMAWLGRLARALVRDPSTADDIAQDTWLAAAGRVPVDRPLRPWLSRVMLNVVRMRDRSAKRRTAREAAVPEPAPVITADELVDRAELQRALVDAVLALAEPYRSTVLLHFFEELSSADIARRLGVPEGTVRRRLKVALDELRARLATRPRRRSLALLAAPLTRITMKKLTFALVLLLLVVLAAFGVWKLAFHHSAATTTPGGGPASLAVGPNAPHTTDATGRAPWFVQPGAPARRVAGHVVFEGKPFAGAIVRLANIIGDDPRAGVRGGDELEAVTTKADGSFDFGMQPAATIAVSAEANGKQPAAIVVATADPKAKPDQLVLELAQCRTRVFGTVVDSSGGGIAKARLRVTGLGGTNADDTGAFSLCVPLDSTLHVEADGYGALELPFHLVGELRHDFELVPEAVLVGRVVDDTGKALPFAHVYAAPQQIEQAHYLGSGSTTADGDGHFRIPKLAPGRFLLSASGEGLSTRVPQPAVATTGTTGKELALVVSRHARVTGRVVADGKAVAGACVTTITATTAPKLGAKCGYSQADGHFVLDGIPLGRVRFDAPPFHVAAPQHLTLDKNLDDVTIEVSELASLHGRTLRHGTPVPNVVVQTTTGQTATSDGNGAYELLGLPAGKIQLIAQVAGDVNAFMPLKTVTLGDGAAMEVDLDLSGGAEVHGIVVDEAGKPLPNVYVRLIDAANADLGESMTDAKGTFDCTSMAGGSDYRASVFPSPGARQAFSLSASNTTDIFHLPNGDTIVRDAKLTVVHDELEISGRVIDDTGAPIADVHVEAIGRAGSNLGLAVNPGNAMLPSIRADADGHFTIGNLAPGAYTVHAHAGDGSEAEVPNVVAGTSGTEIHLVRPGTIEGQIIGFSATPRVHARQLTNQLALGNEAVVEGDHFSITGLTPGKYVVEALLDNEHDGQSIDLKSGATVQVTLRSKGAGTVDGTVYEFGTHKPLAGMSCFATQSVSGQAGDPNQATPADSDAKGGFHIAAPVGRARVMCFPPDSSYSVAGGDADVPPTGSGHIDLAAVKAVPPPCDPGFAIKPLTLPLVIAGVDPAGPAKGVGLAIGDHVMSIDGQSTQGLLPSGAMTVAWNHRPGSTLVLGVERGGAQLVFKIVVAKQTN